MNYVLDTNVVIYVQKGVVAEALPVGSYFVSVVTEIELLSYPNLTTEQEGAIVELLREVTVVGISPEVKQLAINLRRVHRLRIPDAIIAATALNIDAELLTNDTALVAITNLRCRRVRLQSGQFQGQGD